MKRRGSTPNVVGVYQRNIHKKFKANPCKSFKEVKQVYDDGDGHRAIAGHTHEV